MDENLRSGSFILAICDKYYKNILDINSSYVI